MEIYHSRKRRSNYQRRRNIIRKKRKQERGRIRKRSHHHHLHLHQVHPRVIRPVLVNPQMKKINEVPVQKEKDEREKNQ